MHPLGCRQGEPRRIHRWQTRRRHVRLDKHKDIGKFLDTAHISHELYAHLAAGKEDLFESGCFSETLTRAKSEETNNDMLKSIEKQAKV